MHKIAGVRRESRLVGFVRLGAWIIAILVPTSFLLKLFALTLYSVPESDDFCFAYLHLQNGFGGTLSHYYHVLIGRVVPVLLMQVPAAISRLTFIDYFIGNVLTLALLEIVFAGATIFVVSRIWPLASFPQWIAMAAALAATMAGEAPSLREMLYWLPGVSCYMVPAAIAVVVFVELINAAENGAGFSTRATCMLAIGCFLASLCNEFTPVWLIGTVVFSLSARKVLGHRLELRSHALIGLAAIAGFAVLLLAPGNAVRIGQFSGAGSFITSLGDALKYSLTGLGRLLRQPLTLTWLAVAALATVAQPKQTDAPPRTRLLLAAGVALTSLSCGYFEYFVHQFATGIRLVERAQNEALVFVLSGLTMSLVLLVRSVRDPIRHRIQALVTRPLAVALLPAVIALFALAPLQLSPNARRLAVEQPSFRAFWLEAMGRHVHLTLSTERNLAIPKYRAVPSVLTSSDVTDDPTRLPNDCIASFYGKDAVVARRDALSLE
ncbi:hypothetical protein ACVIIW_006210 [Bradyrhizobium sp. USDA 4449]